MNTKPTFKEFTDSYNKLPKKFENLSAEEALKKIWEHEKSVRGIDWLEAENGGLDALKAAVSKAQEQLHNQIKSLSASDLETAKKHGLLSADGSLPNLHNIFFASNDATTAGSSSTGATTTPNAATFPDSAPTYPVWIWNAIRAKDYMLLRGGDIKTQITNLVRSFQVMEQDDQVGIVKSMMEMGVVAFGITAATAVYRIFATLLELTEATEAYAVLEGVLTVGVNIIRALISLVILAVLIPLMILMAKDAFGLFVIMNNTQADLVMNNITFTHGKCVTGFQQTTVAGSPAIIPKIFQIWNPNVGQQITGISAGFFGVRKRDNALIGTQGAISFASNSVFPKGIFLGWEVPLSIGDNRLLVSANSTGTVDQFSENTDNHGVLNSTDSINGHTIEGHMNSGSGSEAYAFVIASDNKPAGDILGNNQTLDQGFHLTSSNNTYKASMQADGNFVVYQDTKSIWASNTMGKGQGSYYLRMQDDGNLVVYGKSDQVIWASNTMGKGQKPFYLKMQDDGNLVIYDANNKPTWATK